MSTTTFKKFNNNHLIKILNKISDILPEYFSFSINHNRYTYKPDNTTSKETELSLYIGFENKNIVDEKYCNHNRFNSIEELDTFLVTNLKGYISIFKSKQDERKSEKDESI